MKLLKHSIWILAISFLAFSCAQAPDSTDAEVGDAEEVDETATATAVDFAVDTETSSVTWVGTKPVGRHQGTFNITEGSVKVEEDKIVGGTYTIDITSLTVTDEGMDDESKGKLKGHLLSADFFNAEENGTATFEITAVEEYTAPEAEEGTEEEDSEYILADPSHTVSGNLTMNGVTKNIKFPAKVVVDGEQVIAEAKFNINRKDWEMSYGADESLGDQFIRPTVHVGFNITAAK